MGMLNRWGADQMLNKKEYFEVLPELWTIERSGRFLPGAGSILWGAIVSCYETEAEAQGVIDELKSEENALNPKKDKKITGYAIFLNFMVLKFSTDTILVFFGVAGGEEGLCIGDDGGLASIFLGDDGFLVTRPCDE